MDSRLGAHTNGAHHFGAFLGDSVDSRQVGLLFDLSAALVFLGDSVDSRRISSPCIHPLIISFWGIVWTAGFHPQSGIKQIQPVFGG